MFVGNQLQFRDVIWVLFCLLSTHNHLVTPNIKTKENVAYFSEVKYVGSLNGSLMTYLNTERQHSGKRNLEKMSSTSYDANHSQKQVL